MSNYNHIFNSDKYIVKKKKIELENGQCVYQFLSQDIDTSDMLFVERNDGTYEPWMYDFKKDKNGVPTGKRILEGTIAYAFIKSIHYTEQTINSKTKEVIQGNLSTLQWYFGIKIVNSSIRYTKKRWDMEVSRQFGKTHLSARIAGFLPVFAPLFADLPNDRWWQIIASYNDDSVKEIFDLKVKPVIIKNIEFFNKLYPNEPLVYGKHGTENFVNNTNKMEVRRMLHGKAEPHSYVVALSTNTIKDGKSSDWMWCDEAWRTNAKEFRRGILPFLGSTSGDFLVSGISTADTENLMYNIHFEDKNSYPMISDCFSTYNFLMQDFPRRAKNLREMAEEEFDVSGFDSNESLTNYRLTWDVLDDGKFYSLEMFRKNSNFNNEKTIGAFDDIGNEYRVAGLDLATMNDYCVLTVWDVYKTSRMFINEVGAKEYRDVWKNVLREVICYNMDRKPISAGRIAELVAKDCNTMKIDMLLVDGTSTQRTHNEWIYNELREKQVPTMLCPYDFSGDKNKVLLMTNYENMLKAGLVKFGMEKEINEHSALNIYYNEMIKLFKGYVKGKKNMQWCAKGKGNTDDFVMSGALGCYCIPYIQGLMKSGKFIEINSYRYRARMNKFIKDVVEKDQHSPMWMNTF